MIYVDQQCHVYGGRQQQDHFLLFYDELIVQMSLVLIGKRIYKGANFVRFYNLKLAPMGIEGLLNFLTPITVKEHISSFQGKTAAIDIMSWLYKGCYRCAFELNQNIESNNFLYYIFEMLDLLSYYKIRPICVFDGKHVGKKEDTLEKRKRNKEENRQKGMEFLAAGNQEMARKYLSRCIIIDERIIATTMRALFTKSIDFIVAPYESDSQIAKLLTLGLADIAITEDSDLVVYGLRVVLKLNQDGDCDYIDLSKWKPSDIDSNFLQQYLEMDYVSRLEAAILSGTDYNSSVKGIGIKRAVKNIHTFKNMNNVISHLREAKVYSDKVPVNYEKEVLDSKLIFLFATTYNPYKNTLEYLNSGVEDFLASMSEEQLQKVVGRRYDYSEDVRTGRVNLRTNQKREIFTIDFKTVFSLNAANLQCKELANKERRVQEAYARLRREQERTAMAQNANVDNIPTTNHKKKKSETPAIILTEEEKKKQSEERKAERIRRFNDFKQLLNNYIMEPESDCQDEESSSEILKEQLEHESQSPKETNKKDATDEQAETYSDSEPDDPCLQFLNPWLKM